MPVVNIRLEKLSKLVGKELTAEEAAQHLASVGLGIEETTENEIKVEYNPNRPDYSSIYGIARTLKGILGKQRGLPRFRLRNPKIIVNVDPSVEDVRPYIVCGVIRNLSLTGEDLEEIIAMQEDLHWILGRNRKKVAIGLHNLDVLTPPFVYRAVKPEELRFIPLKSSTKMTPKQILEEHEIGRKYAHLLEGYDRYPMILDARGNVLSMPPIINASLTELTAGVRNIFIDVTGTDWEKINQTLNILMASMMDAGGSGEAVIVRYSRKRYLTPLMKNESLMLKSSLVNELLGLNLSDKTIIDLLRMMRFDATSSRKGILKITVPPYRTDIMHPVDLVEEVAIAYGYSRMELELPKAQIFGSVRRTTIVQELIREIMIGLGFTEVLNILLTNEDEQYKMMNVNEHPHIRVLNPATREYTMMRTWLIPSLLRNLADNQQHLYPQRLFEIGDVIVPDHTRPEKARRRLSLAAVSCHADASFSEMKGIAEELFRLLGLNIIFTPTAHPSFIDGRVAELRAKDSPVGIMGEVSPSVLESFNLPMPTTAFEVDVEQALQYQAEKD